MTQRCFIAAIVPPSVKALSRQIVDQLTAMPVATALKFVNPEAVHITMHFLGDLDDKQIAETQEMLAALAIQYHRTQLVADRLSAFPNERKPRVLFLNCQQPGATTLTDLHEALASALSQANLPVEQRRWQPHVTLARAKETVTFNFSTILITPLRFTISEIHLMKSTLQPSGAEYSTIAAYPLAIT